MIETIDIYRSAQLLINKFQEDALEITAQRIASFELSKQEEAVAIWIKIREAVKYLLNQEACEQASIH